jgi:hypothetical protein
MYVYFPGWGGVRFGLGTIGSFPAPDAIADEAFLDGILRDLEANKHVSETLAALMRDDMKVTLDMAKRALPHLLHILALPDTWPPDTVLKGIWSLWRDSQLQPTHAMSCWPFRRHFGRLLSV